MKKLKVLTICNYLTDDDYLQFSRNKTGYGYVVSDIVSELSLVADVSVFTYSGRYKGFFYHKARILGNRIVDIVLQLSAFDVFKGAIFYLKHFTYGREALRVFYSFLSCGYVKHEIKKVDTIHVHGCTPNLIPFIKLSLNSGKRTLVTLHGLNSYSLETKASPLIKKSERRLLSMLGMYSNLYISVLTPRAKDIIVSSFGELVAHKILVIPNFIKSVFSKGELSKMENDRQLVLYVGNLSKQKNQKALLYAIKKNWSSYKGKVKFLFIGDICDRFDDEIEFFSDKKDLVEFTGHIPREQLNQLYSKANLVVLLSKVEGFGMSIIEGFAAGTPVLISEKMEIFSLIGECSFVYAVSNINDVFEIGNKLSEALTCQIDANQILEYVDRYKSSIIIDKYLQALNPVMSIK